MPLPEIPFTLANNEPIPRFGVPLRCSVPMPQGAITDPAAELALVDENKADLGAQWRVLSRWPDDSVRFGLFDYAEGELPVDSKRNYRLIAKTDANQLRKGGAKVTVTETGAAVTIDTGRLIWVLSRHTFSLAQSITYDGASWLDGSDMAVEDMLGQRYRASAGEYELTVEDAGPYRATVLIVGDYRNASGRRLSYRLRLAFAAGGESVLLSHTLRNREPGRDGVTIRRAWLDMDFNLGDQAVRRLLHASRGLGTVLAPVIVPENVDVDVLSWQTRLRNGASLRENPQEVLYSLSGQGGDEMGGHNAVEPLVDLYDPSRGGVMVRNASPDPNQQFPMRIASEGNRITFDFYPDIPAEIDERSAAPMHLNEGMGKTRDFTIRFHDAQIPVQEMMQSADTVSYPGVVGVPRQMYRDMRFADVQHTLHYQPNKYPLLETKLETLMSEGSTDHKIGRKGNTFYNAVGWRDYGDDVAIRGRYPEHNVVQWTNNEEDYIHAGMIDAWRKGKPFGSLRQVRHLMDIDYIDFSTDPARDGSVCPHSTNHTDGEVYPSHQWCQGLIYFYLGTGDPEALRIAKRIGDCLVWWLTGPRKDATLGSGRESAWPLLSMAALYEVIGEETYRDAGLAIIDNFNASMAQHGQLLFESPMGSGRWHPYMLAMTFNGIWDMYHATRDESILELWKQVTAPVIDGLTHPDSFGYIHFRNAHLRMADITVLARWYGLTGDRKYLDLARTGLRLTLQSMSQPVLHETSHTAMLYRHFMFFMNLAEQHDLFSDDQCMVVW